MDEGVGEWNQEDSQSQQQKVKGRSNSGSCPGRGSELLKDTQAPDNFPGGNRDISTLTSLLCKIYAQSTPLSKPTWNWRAQKICCRCGPLKASLPGNEKRRERRQRSSTAMRVLIYILEKKNEGMVTQNVNNSHLLAARSLVSFHFLLLAFLNILQWTYIALGFIHENNPRRKKFMSHLGYLHSATVRKTQTGSTRKGGGCVLVCKRDVLAIFKNLETLLWRRDQIWSAVSPGPESKMTGRQNSNLKNQMGLWTR